MLKLSHCNRSRTGTRTGNGFLTLHGNGTGTSTGNWTRTIGNNGFGFLSISWSSVNMSVQDIETHCWFPFPFPVPVRVQFSCTVNKPLAFLIPSLKAELYYGERESVIFFAAF